MKIQLDFDRKTIKLCGDVNFGEFFKRIKKIVPDWKEWEIEQTTSVVYWSNPYIYHYPYNQWITTSGTATFTNSNTLTTDCTTGIVNMELN